MRPVCAQVRHVRPGAAEWTYDTSLGRRAACVGVFLGKIENRYRNRYRAPRSTRGKLKGAIQLRRWRNWQTH